VTNIHRDETTRDAGAATGTETHHEPHGAAMPHGAADDIAVHGQVDDHDVAPLGPVDTRAWAAAALGIALGLVVAACFFVASVARG
jgi:hypothetical protein